MELYVDGDPESRCIVRKGRCVHTPDQAEPQVAKLSLLVN